MRFRNTDDGVMPLWVKALIIVSCLPVLALPLMISMTGEGFSGSTFIVLYPLYVIVSAVCAWYCYGNRRELAWILIALLWLTHAAMWILVLYQ